MLNFRGFQTIKIVRAVDEKTGGESFAYEAIFHDAFGRRFVLIIKINKLDRDWSNQLRMHLHRFAKMVSGQVEFISEEEWNRLNLENNQAA